MMYTVQKRKALYTGDTLNQIRKVKAIRTLDLNTLYVTVLI